mgnify:CR=1 FL=1
MIQFTAQIKKVTTKTLVSNDVGFCVEIIGEDPAMMEASKFAGENLVKVTLEYANG